MAEISVKELANMMFSADLECRMKHKCKNAVDCSKCELLKEGCITSFIAKRLLDNCKIERRKENLNEKVY